MARSEPGETRGPGVGESRRLSEAPSLRYGTAGDAPGDRGDRLPGSVTLVGPLVRASTVALVGAAVLVAVGTVLASTVGLLFVSGITGAGIGLVLARARLPGADGPAPLSPRAVTSLAIGLAVAAVVGAAIATWLNALREGGVLGPIDYLLTTFGPFVPGELLIAGLTAAWGAGAGPIERS